MTYKCYSSAGLFIALTLLLSGTAGAADYTSYSGEQLFQRFCAACHGKEARGDGPVASQLKVEVPNLRLLAQRNRGQFPAERLEKIIDGRIIIGAHGTRTMPIWGEEFLRNEIGNPAAEKYTANVIRKIIDYLGTRQETKAP